MEHQGEITMSTHVFIPDPALDHSLHVPLQIPAIIIFAVLVIFGVIILYAFFFMKKGNHMSMEY
ncbi:MAG: hypothetical protein CVV33_00645 [Methanomicrobiales archaeon HGW-Methanomicrobiales-4]|nr:MAG: hypothetical protein CVV33_00645 [Methanomicrobiales archaeon HGW-Methanomicrobiales-4]